jgi:hypothetical protein
MSRSLQHCKLRHGWIKPFLAAVKNGYTVKNAANMAGESTSTIERYAAKDPQFKAEFDAAVAEARPRYGHGAW